MSFDHCKTSKQEDNAYAEEAEDSVSYITGYNEENYHVSDYSDDNYIGVILSPMEPKLRE